MSLEGQRSSPRPEGNLPHGGIVGRRWEVAWSRATEGLECQVKGFGVTQKARIQIWGLFG